MLRLGNSRRRGDNPAIIPPPPPALNVTSVVIYPGDPTNQTVVWNFDGNVTVDFAPVGMTVNGSDSIGVAFSGGSNVGLLYGSAKNSGDPWICSSNPPGIEEAVNGSSGNVL